MMRKVYFVGSLALLCALMLAIGASLAKAGIVISGQDIIEVSPECMANLELSEGQQIDDDQLNTIIDCEVRLINKKLGQPT